MKTSLRVLSGIAVAAALAPALPAPAQSDWTKPELVSVPAGSFEMGNNAFARSKPAHKVTLTEPFQIGKFEISNQQYADMLTYAYEKGYLNKEILNSKRGDAWGLSKQPQRYQDVKDEHSRMTFKDGKFKPAEGKENHPVTEVTWHGAAFFCNMLSEKEGLTPLYNLDDWSCQVYGKTGYRLPTEAEWEYAAKFDDGRPYPWGKDEPTDAHANIKQPVKEDADVLTAPVGSKSPKGDSKLGLCDLVGNVAEFCNDWYTDDYTVGAADTDPVGPGRCYLFNVTYFKQFRSAHVVRGGCFMTDPDFRKDYGVPFTVDSISQPQAFDNSFRCFEIDGFSRGVESFRIVKVTATAKTKAAATAPSPTPPPAPAPPPGK